MELHPDLQGIKVAYEGEQVITVNDCMGMINYYNEKARDFNKIADEEILIIDPKAEITMEELQFVSGILISRLMKQLEKSMLEKGVEVS